MDWLLHNSIADMYGPHFLILYGSVIIMTLAVCWWALRHFDPTSPLPPPQVPMEPDPYEIAYLRGQENEVMLSAVFNLMQRGYLTSGEHIQQAPKPPDSRHLSPLERHLFDWFATPRREISILKTLRPEIANYCAPYEQRLQREQLLMSPAWKNTAWLIVIACALVIIGLGGYKLIVALAKGRHNVGFLIIMGLIALVVLFNIGRPSHLSRRGEAYLRRLQQAFEQLKGQAAKIAEAADQSLLLLVGLFGVGVLSGTAYEYYQQLFRRPAESTSGSWWNSGSSCSSSCSSSCGGGGGCGGGCGGCGGA
jgi:uncharacterized protein (TIGR04222 family)